MKGSVNVTSGQHYVDFGNNKTSWGTSHPNRYPIGRGDGLIQVHHFKWDKGSIERVKNVAMINQSYAYSPEYRKMYESLRKSKFKIVLNEPEYMFEKNVPQPEFKRYKQWNKLIKKIISI